MDIPVYLFTGFLDAGKTKFIQESLCDKRFNNGDNILLLLCEEGEEEYNPVDYPFQNVFLEKIENEEDLTTDTLTKLAKKHKVKKIIVEYNGMWQLNSFFYNMPENWAIYQEMLFVDSTTAMVYNSNMRNMFYDKLSTCELVVFNRCDDNTDYDSLHKLVRGVSRQCDIAYEDTTGNIHYDETVDPLPFDINADVIEISDKDYALWYRDMSENMNNYIGKTIKFKGLILKASDLPDNCLVIGRKIMTCCEADIKYAGLMCECNASLFETNDWAIMTAKVEMKYTKIYGKKGPVFVNATLVKTDPPEQPVATFY